MIGLAYRVRAIAAVLLAGIMTALLVLAVVVACSGCSVSIEEQYERARAALDVAEAALQAARLHHTAPSSPDASVPDLGIADEECVVRWMFGESCS